MRQDQYVTIKALQDRLLDVFIGEANPDAWPGSGLVPAAMDSKTRGDRVWCKRDAVATISLVQRLDNLTRIHEGADLTPSSGADQDDPEEAEQRAERQAKKLIGDVQARIASRGQTTS